MLIKVNTLFQTVYHLEPNSTVDTRYHKIFKVIIKICCLYKGSEVTVNSASEEN